MSYNSGKHKNLQGLNCNMTPIALLAHGMSQLEALSLCECLWKDTEHTTMAIPSTCSLQGSGGLVHKDLKCTQVQVQVFLTG